MQNPIGEADLEWILHRNFEGTEQLQFIYEYMVLKIKYISKYDMINNSKNKCNDVINKYFERIDYF